MSHTTIWLLENTIYLFECLHLFFLVIGCGMEMEKFDETFCFQWIRKNHLFFRVICCEILFQVIGCGMEMEKYDEALCFQLIPKNKISKPWIWFLRLHGPTLMHQCIWEDSYEGLPLLSTIFLPPWKFCALVKNIEYDSVQWWNQIFKDTTFSLKMY